MSEPLLFVDTSESNVTVTGNLHVTNHLGVGTTTPDGPLHLNLPTNSNYTGFTYQSGDVKTVLGNTGDGGTNSSFVQVYAGVTSSVPDTNSGTYNLALQPQGGKVGVGTVSPGATLDVAAQHGEISLPMVHFRANRDSASNGDGSVLKLENSGNRSDVELLECVSSGNTRFVVKAGGNVGIGTSSPDQKLDVEGNIRATGTGYVQMNSNGSIWRNYGTTLGAGIHFTDDAVIPADHNGGNHHTNVVDLGASSYKWRNLYVYDQVQSGSVYTTAYMTTTGYIQSTKYNISGASTCFYNAGGLWGMRYNTNTYSWHRWNGPHHFDLYSNSSYSAGGVPFYINYYSGAQVRLNNTHYASDDRIKTNERYITNATQTLLKLKPQIYDKGVNLGCESNETRVESGLIAQDVYYDTPELRHLVGYHDDAEIPDEKPYVDDDPQKDPDYSMWGSKSAAVDYIGLIAYLIKSNQEIHEDLQAEKARNNSLEARILALEKRIN